MNDSISRQAAIDATSEIVFVEYEDDDSRKEESIILQTKAAIRDRIKALPSVQLNHNAEPGKMVADTISRQVAMEMLMAKNVIMDGSEYHNGFNAGVNRAQEVIRNLPPVQSKRGKWIPEYKNPCYNGYYKIPSYCSCCKDYYTQSPEEMNFCPHCGADMRGNEDGTD